MTTIPPAMARALAALPPGRWVVGVSGGADSVALLTALTRVRPDDVTPIVAHLDHQTRGPDSEADARFTAQLAARLAVPIVVAKLADLGPIDEPNDEARFRLARRRLFERVVADHDALGVLLAHHADDRAETTLLRLLRGGEPTALAGLRVESMLGSLRIHRPLLALRRSELEAFLATIDQPFRTDATNLTDRYARNRVRRFLAAHPTLVGPLLGLADAAAAYADWVAARSPRLAESFGPAELADAPAPLARYAARRWLASHGSPTNDLSIATVERLIAMAADRATAAIQTFPGNVRVRRARDRIAPEPARPPRGPKPHDP